MKILQFDPIERLTDSLFLALNAVVETIDGTGARSTADQLIAQAYTVCDSILEPLPVPLDGKWKSLGIAEEALFMTEIPNALGGYKESQALIRMLASSRENVKDFLIGWSFSKTNEADTLQ